MTASYLFHPWDFTTCSLRVSYNRQPYILLTGTVHQPCRRVEAYILRKKKETEYKWPYRSTLGYDCEVTSHTRPRSAVFRTMVTYVTKTGEFP
jgi:hypothetical protein